MVGETQQAPGLDPDRTVLVPRPGARRGAAPAPLAIGSEAPGAAAPARPQPSTADEAAAERHDPIRRSGAGNPLLAAAAALFDIVVPLRNTIQAPDLESLRARLIQAVRDFEVAARAARQDLVAISAARYALCTLLDETVSSTPWGGGAWSGRSLLVSFHNEASGGEKFFQILQKMLQDPRAHIDVIELMYVCLALGLEGRYRLVDGGRDQLGALRERLLATIRGQRGALERDLSPRWAGVVDQHNPLLRIVPLWVAAAVAGTCIVALQLVLSLKLNATSDPVFAQLHGIKVAVAAPAAAAPAAPRLATFLAPEIAQGLVSVDETAVQSTVTLHGDGLFASGSALVAAGYKPLIDRIGDALKAVPGRVLVAGHTDDQRIASLQFPSNWHLSQARARAVMQALAARTGAPERFGAEGRADTEPLVPNDSAANRARNRHVDVTVFTTAP